MGKITFQLPSGPNCPRSPGMREDPFGLEQVQVRHGDRCDTGCLPTSCTRAGNEFCLC